MADGAAESPIAEEATRLLSAVQDWARQNFPAGRDGHMGAECQWCPLCQVMAVVRGERPEVTERVTEAGTALLSAFRSLVDAAGAAAPADRDADMPRVQRIDVRYDQQTDERTVERPDERR